MTGRHLRYVLAVAAVGVALVFVVIFTAAKFFFAGIDALSLCDEQIEQEVISPSNKYVAALIIRNCGATTNYVTHINLRHVGESIPVGTEGVVSLGEVLLMDGQPQIKMFWRDDVHLEIRIMEQNKAAKSTMRRQWDSVRISVSTP